MGQPRFQIRSCVAVAGGGGVLECLVLGLLVALK